MTQPLPTSAGLPEEVPIRSGVSSSAPPSATVSPEGAAGRAEVTAQDGDTGSRPSQHPTKGAENLTSAGNREEVATHWHDQPHQEASPMTVHLQPPAVQPQWNARATIYNGIRMRSRLEAGFAAWCDQGELTWGYEPLAFGTAGGQYLPDFALDNVTCTWLATERRVYVEVKPESFWDQTDEERQWLARRMCVVLGSEPDAILALATSDSYRRLCVVVPAPDPYFAPAEWLLGPGAVWTGTGWMGRLAIGLLLGEGPWESEYWNAK